jgi:hypothetical protein
MIEIKKDPNGNDHLMGHITDEDYKKLAESVDLKDITEFIKTLNSDVCVPDCYWKNKGEDIFKKFYSGGLHWAVYSYLVYKELLIIEDRYYKYNTSRTDKYLKRNSYFNPLERQLYQLIIDRLVGEKYLEEEKIPHKYTTSYYYTLGKSYQREDKLNKLLKPFKDCI